MDALLVDVLRRQASIIENAVIDELLGGHIGKREFLRYASILGMGAPLLAAAGCRQAMRFRGRSGGVVRVGTPVPAGMIDPVTVADTGGVCMLSQTGEYLALSDPLRGLQSMLASRWAPDATGSIWTFKIRKDVKFHDGRSMTATDVVATIDRLADPANGSIALSVFSGVLSKGGARVIDSETVAFHLDAPNGSFPYLVSSDNFSAIILPADYNGDFEQTFNGTGPFRLERYIPKDRASFVRNNEYWGLKALPDRTSFLFYDSLQAQVLAMQGGQLDVLLKIPVHGAQALLADPAFRVLAMKSSAHEQVHLRTDRLPFSDKRVRRAIALCLDRDEIVTGLFRDLASVGNDSPFAPVFAATDPTVPQRRKDLREAKALMDAAGLPQGFATTLTTERVLEIPDYAVVIQNAVKRIGVTINLNVEDQSSYYGRATYGQSDWLDSIIGIEDYAHRGIPDTVLAATLGSTGAFNAARYRNPAYDRLVAGFTAAMEPASRRSGARQIQTLLLNETPVITAYFYDWLSVTANGLSDVHPTAMSQLYLDRAHFR